MGFRQGAYATVWEIKESGDRSTKIRLSTSRKNKKTDEYETDFNGFVRLVGDAHENIGLIEEALEEGERCRIRLGATDVSNRYDKEAGREYVNYTVFEFEMADSAQSDDPPAKSSKKSSSKGGSKKTAAKKASAKKTTKKSALEDEEEPPEGEDDDGDLPF